MKTPDTPPPSNASNSSDSPFSSSSLNSPMPGATSGSPPESPPESPRGSQPGYHLAARYSIIAALVCFAGNCVANQIAWRQGLSSENWFRVTVNIGTAFLVLSGVIAGIYGLVVALRRKAADSAGIAVIGLGLQLGIIALTIWGLWMVTKARRELERQSERGRSRIVSQDPTQNNLTN